MTVGAYREGCEGCRVAREMNDALEFTQQQLTEQLGEKNTQIRSMQTRTWSRIGMQIVAIGAVALLASVVGGLVYGRAKRPSVPEPCQDTVTWVADYPGTQTCHKDAVMLLMYDPLPSKENRQQVRCMCMHTSNDVPPGAR